MTIEIQLITSPTCRSAAQVLGAAFVDDPVAVASYPGYISNRLVQALTIDFTAELEVCIRRGYPIQVNNNGTVMAAAIIYPPGCYPLPWIDRWMIQLKSIIGNGLYDIRNWLKWLKEVEKYHPKEAHFYLEYLGVDPQHQGMRIGTSLLQHLTARADAEGVGCYLENASPRNLPFYQRAGFTILAQKEIIEIPTWFMWRPPTGIPPPALRGEGGTKTDDIDLS